MQAKHSKSQEFDIVILGHIAKDIIEVDETAQVATGGAVYYGGIAGSQLGLKIAIITRLKKEDFPLLKEFSKFGVKDFAYPSAETSGIRNIYTSKNFEYRICKPLGFAGLFKKDEIPDLKTKFFIVGPIIAGEIDLDLLNYIRKKFPGIVCLDIQGFVRVRKGADLVFKGLTQKEKEQILSGIRVLKVDHAEAEGLTGKKDIQEAAQILAKMGPEEILLTHEQGISLYAEDTLYFFPWKNKNNAGRTGRGDTAFVSYIGSRILKSPKESLRFATALTSLKLEHPGPFILPLSQVEDLIKTEY